MIANLFGHNHQFLAGGGEMGFLIRSKDWAKTAIGAVEEWPQSLLTSLSIILNSKFPMFLWWGDELTCFYNDAYRPSLGKNGKHPDILGKPASEAWPEIWDIIKPLIDQVLSGGESVWREDQLIPIYRNGKLEDVYWTFSYSPVNDESGKAAGVLVICSETTQKVNSRRNVEISEQRLKIIIDASELGTWELNLITDEVNYSDRSLKILGHTTKINVPHSAILARLHPEDMTIREQAMKKALIDGYLQYELRLIWENGTIHWIEAKGKVFYNEDKMPVKIIGTFRDITEEKNYQQQLLEREQKFRLLADSMPQHIWTADTHGNINYYNQSVYDYSGLSYEQILKDGWIQIVHPADREENIRTWMNSIRTGNDFLFEHRFRRYDGQYRWQLSRAIAQKDLDGKIQMWVGSSTDIEEQKNFSSELEKKVEERTIQLEQKNRELEIMNTELKSFAYISSHDLQEPLRKIQTFATRIKEKEQQHLSEAGKDYFRRMEAAAKRMQTLIEDLLAYSRTNNSERNFQKTDLNKIVEQVKTELNEDIIQKHATIETAPLCEAKIIPFQFQQLILNLISNSIKFSKPGQPPHIIIKSKIIDGSNLNVAPLSPHKTYYHLSFSDNGIGFDPQYKDRIFEVFQRLHGKDEFKGTGIGLAIVKKIVENHNGIITANSELNKGATFDIYFPESSKEN